MHVHIYIFVCLQTVMESIAPANISNPHYPISTLNLFGIHYNPQAILSFFRSFFFSHYYKPGIGNDDKMNITLCFIISGTI